MSVCLCQSPNPGPDPSRCTRCTGRIVSKHRITCACLVPLWDSASGECDACGGYMKTCECLVPTGTFGTSCPNCGLVVNKKPPLIPKNTSYNSRWLNVYKPPCSDSYKPPPSLSPHCACDTPLSDSVSGKCLVCNKEIKICKCTVPFGSLRSWCAACNCFIVSRKLPNISWPPALTENYLSLNSPPKLPILDYNDVDEQMLAYALEVSKNWDSAGQQQEEIQKYYREQLSLAGALPERDDKMNVYHEDDMDIYHKNDTIAKKIRVESAPAVYWPAAAARPFVMTARDPEEFTTRILAVDGPVTAQAARMSNGLLLVLATGAKEVLLYRHDTWTVLFSKFFDDIWASVLCSDRVYVLTNTTLDEFDLRGNRTYTRNRIWSLKGLEWAITTPNKELLTLCHDCEILTYHLPSGVEYSYETNGRITGCPVWISNNEMYLSEREEHGIQHARIYKHGADFTQVERRDHFKGDIVGVDLHKNAVCTSSYSSGPANLVSYYNHAENREILEKAYYKYDSRARNISKSADAPPIVTVSINRSSDIACIVNTEHHVYVVDKHGPMRSPFAAITADFLPDSRHEIVAGGMSGDIFIFPVTDTWKVVTTLLLGWKLDPNSYIYDFALDLLKCIFYFANLMHVRGFRGM